MSNSETFSIGEIAIFVLAAIVTVGGMWCAYLMRGKTDTLPPPDPKAERNKPGAVP